MNDNIKEQTIKYIKNEMRKNGFCEVYDSETANYYAELLKQDGESVIVLHGVGPNGITSLVYLEESVSGVFNFLITSEKNLQREVENKTRILTNNTAARWQLVHSPNFEKYFFGEDLE